MENDLGGEVEEEVLAGDCVLDVKIVEQVRGEGVATLHVNHSASAHFDHQEPLLVIK
jgi:hypothetical protein